MTLSAPEVTVRALATGGDGVATLPDGRTVFIPRAAPGDRLRLRALHLHKRFARARIDAVLEPGPDRVAPPCPHYVADDCGGCQLMHLSPESQRAAKAGFVGDALRRIARLDVPDPEMIRSPAMLGYRTKVTFALMEGHLGYHPIGDPTRVFDVQDCLLAEPVLQGLFRTLSAARQLLPAAGTRVVLRRGQEGQLHLIVRTRPSAVAWTGAEALEQALLVAGWQVVIWWHPDGAHPRVMSSSRDGWPAPVFEQVHPTIGALVRAAAVASLGAIAGAHAWDLYAGIGQTTNALVERGASVESVELDGLAVELAAALGPSGPRRLTGRAEDLVERLAPPAVIITNPPRTGMAPGVVATLAASGARRIAYVSCDPATLARDLTGLTPSYRLAQVLAFDQFPETAHVETLAVLEPR